LRGARDQNNFAFKVAGEFQMNCVGWNRHRLARSRSLT
jgi:hypothetical protein